MTGKLLFQGAEAKIYLEGKKIIKKRVEKKYRVPELDSRLRRERMKREAKILEKIGKPKILDICKEHTTITMEYIAGKVLLEVITQNNIVEQEEVLINIGKEVKKLHEKGIIHGDISPTNIKIEKKTVTLLDFGLSFWSQKEEDKAVDIHVFKESIKAHNNAKAEQIIKLFFKGYDDNQIEKKLSKVELRGRYKGKIANAKQ